MQTANSLWHAVAGALCGALGASVLLRGDIQTAAFAGALCGLLVNLDRFEMPQGRRTPFAHSLPALLVWSYLAGVLLSALATFAVVPAQEASAVTLGFSLGYASHLLLDVFSSEGVYIFPNFEFPAAESLPVGCDRQWAGWRAARLGKRSIPVDAAEGEPVRG